MSNGVETRMLAARMVQAILFDGRSLKAVLHESLPQLSDGRDRALAEAMLMAVVRNSRRYALGLDSMMPRPLGRRDTDLRALLYVGMAQLLDLQLPAHAALATTVDTAHAMRRTRQSGMVNAILRRLQREGLPEQDAMWEWPDFLRNAVMDAYPDQASDVFAHSAQQAPMFLRVNARRGSRDAYLQRLADAGLHAHAVAADPYAVQLEESVSMQQLPGFAEGDVSVQDLSAQLVTPLLEVEEHMTVFDACAAPGGKTASILERCSPERLVAIDSNARRAQQIRDTLQRTVGDLPNVEVLHEDARKFGDGKHFDRILVDAPCSGTGVVRRQPDILLHRRPEDLTTLVATQRDLLNHAWNLLQPGGVLVYATCSILPIENAEQIAAFVSRHATAVCETPSDPTIYGMAIVIDGRYCGHQRLPGDLDADGFFYARLLKGGPGDAA